MQNVNLRLAIDRLRSVAGEDPESARELSELIELLRTLDGAHGGLDGAHVGPAGGER